MIVRIVLMNFQEDKIEAVKEFLDEVRVKIIKVPGCEQLDILQDVARENIFFSYSHWRSEQDLENYRNSDFFKKTWARAKEWFIDNPRAWSLNRH